MGISTKDLALFGGRAMRSTPLPAWPAYGPQEGEIVSKVLQSGQVNYWTGTQGKCFEQEFAGYCGAKYGIAVSNGSLALDLALRALEIGEDDEVIVTPRSFVISASAPALLGAIPVFADVEVESGNLSARTIEAALTEKTKAVIVVHLAGFPCEMDPILELAKRRGIAVIEDCAQAHGATYKGKVVGSMGDIGVYSFCQDKHMSTGGEGGMVLTSSQTLWERMRSFKDHGKNFDKVQSNARSFDYRYLCDHPGTNYRLSEMQAALGRHLLKKLPEWVEKRRRIASRVTTALESIDAAQVYSPPEHMKHSFYRFYFQLRTDRLQVGWSRSRLIEALQAEGIPAQMGTCSELFREKCFEKFAWRAALDLRNARRLSKESVMLFVHPTLEPHDVDDICNGLRKVFEVASAQPYPEYRNELEVEQTFDKERDDRDVKFGPCLVTKEVQSNTLKK